MSKPSTTELAEVIEAIQTTEAELTFQIDRLGRTQGRTGDEVEHLADLRRGYESARKYIGILRKYQQSRLRRQQEPEVADDEIDTPGEGTAFSVDA